MLETSAITYHAVYATFTITGFLVTVVCIGDVVDPSHWRLKTRFPHPLRRSDIAKPHRSWFAHGVKLMK